MHVTDIRSTVSSRSYLVISKHIVAIFLFCISYVCLLSVSQSIVLAWSTTAILFITHCPPHQIKRLQQTQTALAHTVTRTPKHSHITLALKSLHWLKIEQRIQFKIVSITHNFLHKSQPSYLRKLIYIKPTGKTRSSDHLCLSLPPITPKLKFSDRSLRNASPRLWNSLPTNLRSFSQQIPTSSSPTSLPFNTLSLSRSQFLSRLKTHLHLSFILLLNSPPSSPIYGFQPVSSAPLVYEWAPENTPTPLVLRGLYKSFILLFLLYRQRAKR